MFEDVLLFWVLLLYSIFNVQHLQINSKIFKPTLQLDTVIDFDLSKFQRTASFFIQFFTMKSFSAIKGFFEAAIVGGNPFLAVEAFR